MCIFQKFLIAMFIKTSLLGTCHLICSSYLLAPGYFREFTVLVESNNKQVGYFPNWLFWGRNSTDLGLAWWLRVRKVLANAGDMGLIADPGRPHTPRSNWARAPRLLSPHAATTEAPVPYSSCSATREPTAMRSAHVTTREEPPLASTRENEDPAQSKINKILFKNHSFCLLEV